MSHLLDHSGVTALIEAEPAGRPGPRGLPIRTVLLGLLLSIQYTGKATLCDAWRLVQPHSCGSSPFGAGSDQP
ncbi:hypothetical protein [Streptosporangium sp. NPDC049644]|uniref:hypothetical protein n=1 Tax=Streptosporangium sp. NPDC049644 TaxID=3155507 RepID=UPI00343DA7F5